MSKELKAIDRQLQMLSLNLQIEASHSNNKVIELIADEIRKCSVEIDQLIKQEECK